MPGSSGSSLVGLSWGGKLAVASALDQPDGFRALVLVTPGLVPRVGYSLPERIGIALALVLGGRARFHVPIEPEMFTRTPPFLDYIVNDPLRLQRVSARFLLASHRLDRWIRSSVQELSVPVLLFLAGHDRIVDNERTRALLERLPPASSGHGSTRTRRTRSSSSRPAPRARRLRLPGGAPVLNAVHAEIAPSPSRSVSDSGTPSPSATSATASS
jgi:pimeloyl-ACP methyl ester carboxylesterase